jgi:RNase H-fold protein (predicted Holliday junction resolvase)
LGVELFDERLSSFEADQVIDQLERREKGTRDALAAQVILQRFFDTVRL